MTLSRQPVDTLWSGPDRAIADRLLAHCITTHQDPPAELFGRAVLILSDLSKVVRLHCVFRVEDRVYRDAYLAEAALVLARLAL